MTVKSSELGPIPSLTFTTTVGCDRSLTRSDREFRLASHRHTRRGDHAGDRRREKSILPDCSYREMTEWALPVEAQDIIR